MIKVSVFYPSGQGNTFDMNYYIATHMPLVRRLLGPALKKVEVDQGLAGSTPGSPPTYLAIGHLFFESLETFQAAFDPQRTTIAGDVPNYTNTQATIQISEVKL